MFHLGSQCTILKITHGSDQKTGITTSNLTFLDITSHLIDRDLEKFSKFYTKDMLLFQIIFYTCPAVTRADLKNDPSLPHN